MSLFVADWQDGPVSQIQVEFVPMFWGPAKWSQWSARVSEMKKKTPKHLMAFNEPDVKGQANMDANYAAQLYMQEINPWASKGVKLGSPAIVWDLNWMNTFLTAVKNKGGHIDFICLHWCVIGVVNQDNAPIYIHYPGTAVGMTWLASRNTFRPHILALAKIYGLLSLVSPAGRIHPKNKLKRS
jgi:hypothetical protein